MSGDGFASRDGRSFRLIDVVRYLVGMGGVAFSITVMFLAMRSVMDVGGACADGGPYVSAQSCPAGSSLLMFVGIFGIFGWGGLALWSGSLIGGVYGGLPYLAWPGLILSLGWNFLDYGIASSGAGHGPDLGWLIPGVMFVVMGGGPLLLAIYWRHEFASGSGAAAVVAGMRDRSGRNRISSRAMTQPDQAGAMDVPVLGGSRAGPRAQAVDVGGEETSDLVSRLERLADLHARGVLTDEEFSTAKADLLR